MYAGFLKPGRHQIIIYDKPTNKYWAKNIVVDLRKSEILSGRVPQQDTRIMRHKSSEGIQVNLDNSVYRNFKRLLKSNILKCVQNDTRFWIGNQIIEDEQDY